MKVLKFSYKKESETKDYELLVLKELVDGWEGLSIKDLPEDKRQELFAIVKEYEEKLNPFIKQYRRFKKDSVEKFYE